MVIWLLVQKDDIDIFISDKSDKNMKSCWRFLSITKKNSLDEQ